MSKPVVKTSCSFREMIEGKDTDTTVSPEFQLEPVEVLMLEMEDVLFHLDSAVMMPERPKGKSSSDGDEDDATDPDDAKLKEDQDKVSGLRAVALALKQFEFDPDKRLLIAGHADTSGPTKMNFELSELRSQNVLSLLEGNPYGWADISEKRHRIEDYQQILMYVKDHRSWSDCDPVKIDDKWSDDVDKAIRAFIKRYNDWATSPDGPGVDVDHPISEGTADKIKQDYPKHKWPLEMWFAVYNIYDDDIAAALQVDRWHLNRDYRYRLQFCKEEKKYIACGESYPIDDAEKDNYRSQVNRRVELFFFDQANVPTIDCPARVDSVHKAPECPMWHKYHFKRVYVDGADLNARAYHLKFLFYSRVKQEWLPVPDGLPIKAIENRTEQIKAARLKYSGGVYTIKVPDKPKSTGSSKGRDDIHFIIDYANHFVYQNDAGAEPEVRVLEPEAFTKLSPSEKLKYEKGKPWIHIDHKEATPVIVIISKKLKDHIKAAIDKKVADGLIKPEEASAAAVREGFKYYDLPELWSSWNYWTRSAADLDTGQRYQKAMEKIRPYGGEATTPDKALTFSLDDIVLLDTITGTQDIRDANHSNENHSLSTVATRLSNDKAGNRLSRVKILLIDEKTGHLKLYYREYKEEDGKKKPVQNSARIPFPENLIVEKHEDVEAARIVFFRDGFYTIGDKRTRVLSHWETSGFVVGARAAVRNDTDFHKSYPMPPRGEFRFTGDYDWHFFHHLYLEGSHPVSYFIYQLSISFIRDVRNPASGNPIPTAADVLKFVDAGVYNAMDRWNIKKRYFDEETTSDHSELIKPFYFFDERETFVIPDASHPVENVSIPDPAHPGSTKIRSYDDDKDSAAALAALQALFNSPAFTNARQNALGGKSKFVALIARDENGVRYGPAYAWAVRLDGSMYSIFKLNKSAWEDVEVNHPGAGEIMAGEGDTGFAEFGETFGIFTAAHEFGHACGLPDEYIVRSLVYGTTPTVFHAFPGYDLHFEPYSPTRNVSSMMYHNRAPRLHHLWYGLHFINSSIADGSLAFFANNQRFVARFVHADADLTYHRGKLTRAATGVRHLDAGSTRLPLDFRQPAKIEEHSAIPGTTDKQLRLSLFDLGQDESSHNNLYPGQNNYDYQGILCIRIMLQVNFVGAWTQDNMSLKLTAFEAAYLWRNASYRLVGGTKGIEKIYFYFYPGFRTDANTRTNYIVDFLSSSASGATPRIDQASGHLRVQSNATAEDLVAYILHTASAPNELTGLGYLRSWVNTQLSDTFTLEEIT
jgi:hypothetical protein